MSMIERVARAIHKGRNGPGRTPWAHLPKSYQEPYLTDARAAIAAMRGPTREMLDAVRGMHSDQYVGIGMGVEAWASMIDTALGEEVK